MASNTTISEIKQLIIDLGDNNLRDEALSKICSRDGISKDLGPMLWFTFRTIDIFLEEIVSLYGLLSPPSITPEQSVRIRRILILLQCVASHPETKILLLNTQIIAYLHPFIETSSDSQPLEDLRHHSLGVIASFLIEPHFKVVFSVLSLGTLPLILNSMKNGSEPSKTTAAFILYRMLLTEPGSVCESPELVISVNNALGKVVNALVENPSERLYRLVIRCYLRLSRDPRGALMLRLFPPTKLVSDEVFRPYWEEHEATGWCRLRLIEILV